MKKIITVITIAIIIMIIFTLWWNYQLKAVSSEKKDLRVTIAKGKTVSEIGKLLEKEKLIHSALVFNLYVRSKGLSAKISAGTFKISPALSTPQIVEVLTGKPAEVWVTLIEGLRVEEMADQVSSKFEVRSSKFLEIAREGYMFPDTYLFPSEVTEQQIIKKLTDNFEEKYSDDLRSKIRAQGLTDGEGIILASIVEREARSDQERIEVAAILLKRLKIGMLLNADATIQYALGYQEGEKRWWKRHLTHEDLKVESPYNTYLYKGLPPTPICNPGLASIKAVVSADGDTPYLYYYHDSKGIPHYAKTLEEHNQNIANNP